jgi:flagellar biosynthesis protein FlhB
MAEQAGNRTEQATGRRKEEARKKGQVAMSREVPAAAVLLAGVAMGAAFAAPAVERMTASMREWLGEAAGLAVSGHLGPEAVQGVVQRLGTEVLMLVLPFLGGVMVIGSGSYVAQTGLLWRADGLTWDAERINPLAGLGRMFSTRSVVELIKSVLKVTVIAGAGVLAVRQDLASLPEIVALGPAGILGVVASLAFKMALWIAVTVAALAAADFLYQRYEWQRNLMMTREEVRQEFRETEGDPIIKARVRSLQRAMAKKRMMADVPKADVVITNPTHVAVALKYDHGAMAAPVVVAKGMGYVAERIKALAREHGVMVVEQPVIARSLYKMVEIGREIPMDLYRAVAEILALVYRARGRQGVS